MGFRGQIVIASFLIRKGYSGFAFWPFIILRDKSKVRKNILRHERIHLQQQLEMLVLPFYLWYFVEYLIRRMKHKSWKEAYLHISFEQEAYAHEHELDYLKGRRPWAWWEYL